MTNQQKVQLYRANKNNPLRKQYLKEYKEVTKSKFNSVWILNIVLAFVIGIIFLNTMEDDFWSWILCIVGLLNLAVMVLSIVMDMRGTLSKMHFSAEIEALNKKYEKLGYIHDDIESVLNKCYDLDARTSTFTCPFTGQEYYGLEGNQKCVSNSQNCPVRKAFMENEYQ